MKYQSKQEAFDAYKIGLEKVIEHFKSELAVVRAGRANPKILDRVMVDYYGSQTPLNQMSNITVPEPRSLLVNIWDMSAFKDVIKALNEANLGVNPITDGDSIRLVFPTLTEDRRRDLVKVAKKYGEEAKVAIRNIRRDYNDKVKKDKELPEDLAKKLENDIQKATDEAVKNIDASVAKKEKEIMEI